jgi:hypothetical protein
MGKQVKRVPINFDWPMNKIWWGYELPEVVCQTCAGMGRLTHLLTSDIIQKGEIWHIHNRDRCPTCDGKGKIRPIIEIPTGTGYQLWDTAHNWSPVSLVFLTPEQLAAWLTEKRVFAFGIFALSYEQWLDFILGDNETLATFIKSDLDQYLDRLDASALNFIEEVFAAPADPADADT